MDEPGEILRFGECELDFARRELRRAGAPVPLSLRPLRLLLHLARHRDRAIERRELFDAVWGEVVVGDESLTQALAEVRRAVGDSGDTQRVIRTQKGIGYRFVAEATAVREERSSGARGSVAEARESSFGIAVLPVATVGSHAGDLELAGGLTEQITHALASNGYPVVSRTTAAHHRERVVDVRELGAALGVSHVLEGSVRRDAERVRVTLRLIATDTGKHVWSEAFEEGGDDPFAIQDRLASRVAVQVYHFVWQDAVALARDPEAKRLSELIVESRQHYLDFRMEDHLLAAERVLELAPEREPYRRVRSDTHAWMSLAWSNLYSVLGTKSFEQAKAPLVSHAEASVAIAPDSPLAHMALSRALASTWRWEEAEREMEITCRLAPRDGNTSARSRFWVGAALGRVSEQLEGARLWARSSPANGSAVGSQALVLMQAGRLDEAEPIALRAAQLGWSVDLPSIQWRLGKRESAVESLRRILERAGAAAAVRDLDILRGDGPESVWRWRAALRTPEPVAGITTAAREFLSARTYAELGDMESALAAIERSFAAHEPGMELQGLDVIFDPIRDTPRFRALIEHMGLTAYHEKYGVFERARQRVAVADDDDEATP